MVQKGRGETYIYVGVAVLKIRAYLRNTWPFYLFVFILALAATVATDNAVTAMAESTVLDGRRCVVIDAGHGGIDGGATSCTGVLESHINLQIAQKLNDLLIFMGYQTKMVRTEDVSIHTQGNTIAAKKISDLKQRVRIAEETNQPIYISIHQNYFQQSQYSGTQVFYAPTEGSDQLAASMQSAVATNLQPNNKRLSKRASGVYLMEHLKCTAVLLECGFLSNPVEEAKLTNPDYQNKLCIVVACCISKHLDP